MDTSRETACHPHALVDTGPAGSPFVSLTTAQHLASITTLALRMDDTPTNEIPEKDFNKLDLTRLQSFSFGTQWTQDKPDTSGRPSNREGRRDDRPRRDAPPSGGPGGPPRRDRRDFRKPAGAQPSDGGAGAPPPDGGRRDFRDAGDNRGPRREFRGDPRGPRHDGPREPMERGPYLSPFFNVTFYPEDTSFAALAKTIRASCRTFELFDIAKTVIGKIDRFVVVVQRKPAGGHGSEGQSEAPGAPVAPFSISVPDGLPFESDDAAINHVMSFHLGHFFDASEAEVEAPKGNFQVVNKCGVTGVLLGPPNYHRYNQIVQQHHAAKVARMPLEAFRSRIETVRDQEVINQWLEQMKKVTRYTWKHGGEDATPLTFDNLEDARLYLLTQARDKVVRQVESARFPGKQLEALPQGEIHRAIEGTLERQRRFPLDTANALRGRLRREGFTIFKKGSKGVSYVCAVKRKFRIPGQVFADSIGNLIAFIEAHPMVKASELSERILGIKVPAQPARPAAPIEGGSAPAHEVEAAVPAATLSVEEQQKVIRLQGDLRWLVTEGYVTEFMDGRLFSPPPMVEARKKEVESAEHDPENFPEIPADAPAPAPVPVPTPTPVAPPAEAVAPAADTARLPTEVDPVPAEVEPVAGEPEATDADAPPRAAPENA